MWTVEASYTGLYNVFDEDNNTVAIHKSKDRADLIAAAPALLEALILLLNARDIRQRIGLWPQKFKQIKIKGSASRRRFERHYAIAIMKVIKAEAQARTTIAKAKSNQEIEHVT